MWVLNKIPIRITILMLIFVLRFITVCVNYHLRYSFSYMTLRHDFIRYKPWCYLSPSEKKDDKRVKIPWYVINIPDYGPRYNWTSEATYYFNDAIFFGQMAASVPGGIVSEYVGPYYVLLYSTGALAILNQLRLTFAEINLRTLVVSEFFVGCHFGIIYTATLAWIARWAPPNERGIFVATIMGDGLGAALEAIFLTLMTPTIGYRGTFYVLTSVIVLYFIALFFLVLLSPPTAFADKQRDVQQPPAKKPRVVVVEENAPSTSAGPGSSPPSTPNPRVDLANEPSTSRATRYCQGCRLEIPIQNWTSHLRTLRHKANDCVAQEEGVSLIKTSFRNRVATYRLTTEKGHADLEGFLQNFMEKFVKLVGDSVKKYSHLKVGIELFGRFLLQTSVVQEVKSFNTKFQLVNGCSDLEELYTQFSAIIGVKLTEFEQKESGWSLQALLHLDISVNKINPLKASSYLPLPKQVEAKKAVLNIKNADQRCFMWSVLAHLHPIDRTQHANRVANYSPFENELEFTGSNYPEDHKLITANELYYIKKSQRGRVTSTKSFPPLGKIMTSRTYWSVNILNFGKACTSYYYNRMMFLFLYHFMGIGRHIVQYLKIFPGLGFSGVATLSGLLADFLRSKKIGDETIVVRAYTIFSHVIPGCILIFMGLTYCYQKMAIILLIVGYACSGSYVISVYRTVVDITPNYAGTMYGLSLFFSSLVRFTVPRIRDRFIFPLNNGIIGWSIMFLIGGGCTLGTGIIFMFFGSGQGERWNLKSQDEFTLFNYKKPEEPEAASASPSGLTSGNLKEAKV